jgi:cobalt-precorrin 5A hydrolase
MTKRLYVAGIGCRRDCSLQQLLELLQSALHYQNLQISDLSALASSSHKQHEPALHQLAAELKLPLLFACAEQLSAYDERLSHHSKLSLQVTGSAGVAQASALALAEQLSESHAELLGERLNNASATCAIAVAAVKETL